MGVPIKVDIEGFTEDDLDLQVSQGKKQIQISGTCAEMSSCCGMTEVSGLSVRRRHGSARMTNAEMYALAKSGLKKALKEGYVRRDADYLHRVGKIVCTDVVGGTTGKTCEGVGFTKVGKPSINPKTGRRVQLYEFGLTPTDVKGLRRNSQHEPHSPHVKCVYLDDGVDEDSRPITQAPIGMNHIGMFW